MSSIQGSELWNEGLKLVSYCPVCETRYNPMEAQLLGQDGETHLLHVQCRTCHNSILALVLVNPSGASSVGLLTDLSYEDFDSFFNRKSEWHDELDSIRPATRNKLRQVLFRMLREADLLTADNAINPVMLSVGLLEVISQGGSQDVLLFPTVESDFRGIPK